jgi:hypothetical protein
MKDGTALCDHCGAETCVIWMAPDDLWVEFNGCKDGIACPECFMRWAVVEKGIAVCFDVRPVMARV